MSLIRQSTFIARIKALFGFAISFIMLVTMVFPGTVKTTSKVVFETEKSISTSAEGISFTVENKSPYAIERYILLSGFEKKVGDEWTPCSEHLGYAHELVKKNFMESNILAGEKWTGSINFSAVTSEDGHGGSGISTLEKGQYRITIGYQITGSTEVSYTSCEFSVA